MPILWVLLAHAGETAPKSIQQWKKTILPATLTGLAPGKSTPEDALRTLGKPVRSSTEDAQKRTSFAYRVSGPTEDTVLIFKEGKLTELRYHPNLSHEIYWLSEMAGAITRDQILEARSAERRSSKGHDKGRVFVVKWPDQGLALEFSDVGRPYVVSLQAWDPGQGEPSP